MCASRSLCTLTLRASLALIVCADRPVARELFYCVRTVCALSQKQQPPCLLARAAYAVCFSSAFTLDTSLRCAALALICPFLACSLPSRAHERARVASNIENALVAQLYRRTTRERLLLEYRVRRDSEIYTSHRYTDTQRKSTTGSASTRRHAWAARLHQPASRLPLPVTSVDRRRASS